MVTQIKHRNPVIAKAAELWSCSTDADGKLEKLAVIEAVHAWLVIHPEYSNIWQQASDAVEQIDVARRPKTGIQSSLFDPDAYIATGEGTRVQMGRASKNDTLQWMQILTTEHLSGLHAYTEKLTYINSRIAAWEAHHATLADVERDLT